MNKTTEELRQDAEVKQAIERLKSRFPDPDDLSAEDDMGIWVNPDTMAIFTAGTDDPLRDCVLVYSVLDGEL
jgi:hypothetical protein